MYNLLKNQLNTKKQSTSNISKYIEVEKVSKTFKLLIKKEN